MTETSAKVLLDSISTYGDRVTTVEVTHHRFILAETNTHKAISKNSASSRAIPLEKMLDKFVLDPAFPASWRAEQKGMSGGIELEGTDAVLAHTLFKNWNEETRDLLYKYISRLELLYGEDWKQHALHKSWINRLMEPMQWHTAIWTFDHNLYFNLQNQRLHPDAQPEFYELMKKLQVALKESEPQKLDYGDWHMPLIREEDDEELWDWADFNEVTLDVSKFEYVLSQKRKISAARCARVSYLTHDGTRSIEEDIRLHDRLANQNPPHASPFEHVCTPADWNRMDVSVPMLDGSRKIYIRPRIGNLYGWLQMRHAIGMP